ncbi:MAG TPA: histone deacetylase [Myxococcales bacterium]|jgi:acetoin utilization deacetylase AcuC-like enzyme|nr:histone deacetylase [Myxococcales bacterium]
MPKYRLLRERLVATGVLARAELEEADLIDRASLLLAHTPHYVETVFSGSLTEADQRRIGFPWSEGLLARSRASVQGTVAAARAALRDGMAGNLAGGTHHAAAGHGSGFCVFNDIAVAARALQRDGAIDRALVVDLDVHQGDGTAAIFEGDDSVFTFSMHGAKNFPFRKQRSSLDVDLRDGCDDTEYLEALARHLPEVMDRARADIVFFQAGVDPLQQDLLGRLELSLEGLRARDRMVARVARERGIPLVLTLGGGYANPIAMSVEAHAATWAEARAAFGI